MSFTGPNHLVPAIMCSVYTIKTSSSCHNNENVGIIEIMLIHGGCERRGL